MFRFFPGLVLALACVFCVGALGQELEPNNPCQSAQDFGAIDLPFSVFGALSPDAEALDVDFFRLVLTPGESVRADLEGAPTGQGTLGDPYLGLFDSSCNLIAANDDSGTLNSRLIFQVPADGIAILGVTACCDGDFVGGGEGSYFLGLSRVTAIESIAGRIIDGETGEAVPGSDFPFASVQLLRCDDIGCSEFVNFQQADDDGRFLFSSDYTGTPLPDGTYQVLASAAGFQDFSSGQFEAAEDEAVDLGDLPLARLEIIGSVAGRVLDSITGDPLTGFASPFAIVYLERCDAGDCFTFAAASPDFDGSFVFEGALYSIAPGTFKLRGIAEDYVDVVSTQFVIGALETVDVGDLLLTPYPIRFGTAQECQLPPGGGFCEFGVTVANWGPGRYRGEAWSTVDLYSPATGRNTRFQVGNVGTSNPMPQRLNLKQGQSTVLKFQLNVPPTVADGSLVCATVSVGHDPTPQFTSQGDHFVFCAEKRSDGFEMLSGKEGRRHYRDFSAGVKPGQVIPNRR